MKQLIQSYKTGELGLFEVPPPICEDNGILVETSASLVSAGTEKMIVDIAKKSLLGKAKDRPDLVKQVVNKMKQEGVKNTLEKVITKIDTPIALGYSCAGRVIEVGKNIDGTFVADRVACGGSGYANHSEINYIPKNLFVKIPENVDDIDASFVTVGSIALQGVRQAQPALGEKIVVIGLGLIGQLTVQILKANGCKVLGIDIDDDKLKLAKELGADMVSHGSDTVSAASQFSGGKGVDCVIITASTPDNQPVIDAGEISRLKGKVVVVGLVGMNIPRDLYYKKELELKLSMAYGPGRHDQAYEEKGIDYPYSYVRWTEQRNFEAFLELIAEGKVTPKKLITHQFDFKEALKAYELLEGKTKEKYLGIILKYPHQENNTLQRTIDISTTQQAKPGNIKVGLIGAGNFTKSVLLPTIQKVNGIELVGLCTATGVSAHSTGKKYGFKYITTDNNEILNHIDINTVIITLRHNSHAQYVTKALKAGKHVFTEKPLCIKETELEDIKSVYSSTPSQMLMVGFNRRFSHLVQKMKESIKDEPVSIIYRVNAGPISKDSWIQDMEVGGGRIIGEVCHFIDTCSYLTGAHPASVFASCIKTNDSSIPDEDNLSFIINFKNGSTASINYFAYGNKQMPKEYIEAFAGGTAMQMDDFKKLIIYKGNKKKVFKQFSQDKGFKDEWTAFADSIKTGKPAIDFESIYNTTKTAFMVIESLKTGLPAKID